MTPMDSDLEQHFRAVFDAHNDAIRVLRQANGALQVTQHEFGEVLVRLVAAQQAMSAAMTHHDEAMAAALTANAAALDLLQRVSRNGAQ
jgi:hypothetical protein